MKYSEREYDIIDYVLDIFDINSIPYGERLEHYIDYNDGCVLYHVIVPHNPLTESVDETDYHIQTIIADIQTPILS